MGVVLELLECGADPNQADKVRGILSTVPICPLVDNNYCLYRMMIGLLFTGPVGMDVMR